MQCMCCQVSIKVPTTPTSATPAVRDGSRFVRRSLLGFILSCTISFVYFACRAKESLAFGVLPVRPKRLPPAPTTTTRVNLETAFVFLQKSIVGSPRGRSVRRSNNRSSVSLHETSARNTHRIDVTQLVLDSRGFQFDLFGSMDRRDDPPEDFDVEWNLFAGAATEITGLQSARYEDAETAEISFVAVMKTLYENEAEFRDALFETIKKSLGDLCEASENEQMGANAEQPLELDSTEPGEKSKASTTIRLANSHVGFAVERASSLGFPDKYGIGRGGDRPDVVCVVFGKGSTIDVTAAVKLKLNDTSCERYDYIDRPDLRKAHAGLGQALLYAIDIWHCLARRGYSRVSVVPALVLAARRWKTALDKDSIDKSVTELAEPVAQSSRSTDDALAEGPERVARTGKGEQRLCCMEGYLSVPSRLGEGFSWYVGQCVEFPSGQESDEIEKRYTRAIAMFLKTMRFGLTCAQRVQQDRHRGATSLCFSEPLPGLELLASPIPGAKPSASGVVVSQGELFKFTGAGKTIQDWLRSAGADTTECLMFADPKTMMDGCIVKISCDSVHDFLIAPYATWDALTALHKGGKKMRTEMANVLLASAFISNRHLIMIMKDVSDYHNNPEAITPVQRWKAFQSLVNDQLLPMARLNVFHADIRFDPDERRMSNVVWTRRCGQEAPTLRLIDFESFARCGTSVRFEMQQHAISASQVGAGKKTTAYQVLFWQVLWAAYVWHADPGDSLLASYPFIRGFSTQSGSVPQLTRFQESIGTSGVNELREAWGTLATLYQAKTSDEKEKRERQREAARIVKKSVKILFVCFSKSDAGDGACHS